MITQADIKWKLRAHMSISTKKYQYFISEVDGLEVEMEVYTRDDNTTTAFWFNSEKYDTEADLIAAARERKNKEG